MKDTSLRARGGAITVALAIAGAAVLASSTARAHIVLNYPTPWTVDSDGLGDPQKAFPCGVQSTDTYTMSNVVTAFSPGQTITVKWTEEIAHDGWFRIALSYADGAEFQSTTDFPEPTYQTTNGAFGTMSVDAGIENPVVPPVLADGLWQHLAVNVTAPKQYSQAITLPTRPCAQCVLQVIQIMLNHPVNQPDNVSGAGFTYHHCAFISIAAGGDGGTQRVADAGAGDGATVVQGGSGSSSGTNGSSGSTGSTGSGSSGGTTASSGAGSSGSSGSSGSTSNGAFGTGQSSGGGCSCSTMGAKGGGMLAGLTGLAFSAAFVRRRRQKGRDPADQSRNIND